MLVKVSVQMDADLNTLKGLLSIIPLQAVKIRVSRFGNVYHDYTDLSNRHKGENLQLNIELHQGAGSGSLFAFPILGSLSIITSKIERNYYK